MNVVLAKTDTGRALSDALEFARDRLPGAGKVVINLVWEPYWTPERIEPKVRAYMGL